MEWISGAPETTPVPFSPTHETIPVPVSEPSESCLGFETRLY